MTQQPARTALFRTWPCSQVNSTASINKSPSQMREHFIMHHIILEPRWGCQKWVTHIQMTHQFMERVKTVVIIPWSGVFCPASCIHVTILKLTQQSTPILTVATNQVSLLMIGFVDDSNGQVNMFQEEDTIEVLSLMYSKARKTQQHGRSYWELPAAL